MNEELLQEMICLFLKINCTPSDEQFHALACALGVDHETLESISYAMLAESEEDEQHGLMAFGKWGQKNYKGDEVTAYKKAHEKFADSRAHRRLTAADEGDAVGEEDLSDAQEVLDGDYDPNTTQTNDLMLNDGLPAGEDSSTLLQETTLNDGVSDGDTGAGIADQNILYSDGLAPIKLGASARLRSFGLKG
jgi:hypothetical protein